MGRPKNTSLKVKSFFIYPSLLPSTGDDPERDYRGVNIRITDKKKVNIQVECYDDSQPQRIRIKAKEGFWQNGKLTGGYSEDTVNRFNACIHNIQSQVVQYVGNNPVIKKPLLMEFLFGSNFANSKRKRTRYVTIPTTYNGRVIDSHDLTSKEIDELIKPHLSKQTFINSDGKEKTIEGVFDPDTGESMIEDGEDFYNIVSTEKEEKNKKEASKAEQERISKLSTEERYRQGLYNKSDIGEVFALTYFDSRITNEFYSKIVVRIFEYLERTGAPRHTKDFNLEWIKNYFEWFEENGWYSINTKTFDPLKYDRQIFFLNKPRKEYKGKTVEKNVNMLKQITAKLQKLNLLPKVEGLENFTFKDITKKKSRKGTRKEYAFTKDEFDTVFNFNIEKKDLPRYQEIYKTIEPRSRYKVTLQDLTEARDMFVIQTMAGGLRGWHDLKTCKIRKHSNKLHKITYRVAKKDDAVENPVNVYIQKVLERNNNELPFIDNEQKYSALIRTVVIFIGQSVKDFDREVKPDKFVNQYVKVYELFRHGFFARKTFGQILSRDLEMSAENIEMFTGHEKEDRELVASYLDNNTIENKTKLLSRLKIGKGLR